MEQAAPIALSRATPDGHARAAVLAAVAAVECRSTPVIAYESAGIVAVVGPEAAALSAADSLGDTMDCTVVVTDSTDRSQSTGGGSKGGNLIYAPVAGIRGYLGRFEIMLAGPNGPVGLGEVTIGRRWVDIALDLTTPGFISGELPPTGYYAPAHDPIELARALAEIPELVGSFEKPKFVNYDPELCAHGRSGIRACTRCLDACPASAITSLGERIEIDPNLCQGAGGCATACPTGAITYAYPWLGDTLEKLRAALRGVSGGRGQPAWNPVPGCRSGAGGVDPSRVASARIRDSR